MVTKRKEAPEGGATVEVKPSTVTRLGKLLADIGTAGGKLETLASGILTIVKEAKLHSLEAYDVAVRMAYEKNGWNTRAGKPTQERRAVPPTVRTYVWEIRAAIKAGVEVWKFGKLGEVRRARQQLAEARRVQTRQALEGEQEAETPPELSGVRLSQPEQFTGSVFHDLICAYMKLSEDQRELLLRQVTNLLHKYAPVAGKPQGKQEAKRA